MVMEICLEIKSIHFWAKTTTTMALNEPPTRKSCFEIMSWNIGTLKNIKHPLALIIREMDTDIICLQ
jgi:hypothetical protein